MGLRGPTAEFGKRRGDEGQGLEKDSLAGRVEGLAGVPLPGCPGTALPRIRRWTSAAPGNLAAVGVARGREGTDQTLLLRSVGAVDLAPVGADRDRSVESTQ